MNSFVYVIVFVCVGVGWGVFAGVGVCGLLILRLGCCGFVRMFSDVCVHVCPRVL